PPLVGRAEEQQVLSEWVRGVVGGRPGAMVISAPGGTGKTRLARWLAEDVHRRGQMRVVRIPVDQLGSLTSALKLGFYRHLRSPQLERTALEKRLGESVQFADEADLGAVCDFLLAGLKDEDRRRVGVFAPIPPPVSTTLVRRFAVCPGPRPLLVWIDGSGHDEATAIGYWIGRLLDESVEPIGVLWSVDARTD